MHHPKTHASKHAGKHIQTSKHAGKHIQTSMPPPRPASGVGTFGHATDARAPGNRVEIIANGSVQVGEGVSVGGVSANVP